MNIPKRTYKPRTVDEVIEMENNIIREHLKNWKAEAKCGRPFQYKYSLIDNGTLFIYTSEPGKMVGKNGVLCNKYGSLLSRDLGKSGYRRIRVVEVDPFII